VPKSIEARQSSATSDAFALTALFSSMPHVRIPEIEERVELIYMKPGQLTTRLYIWSVTISLAPVRQEFFGWAASLGAG
jgi:hypothetical protein